VRIKEEAHKKEIEKNIKEYKEINIEKNEVRSQIIIRDSMKERIGKINSNTNFIYIIRRFINKRLISNNNRNIRNKKSNSEQEKEINNNIIDKIKIMYIIRNGNSISKFKKNNKKDKNKKNENKK
jgi:hypothetical protein